MNLFFKVAGIVAVLLVFMGAGVLIGARRPVVLASTQIVERFVPNGDGTAFDTVTGKTCQIELRASGSYKADQTCDGVPTRFPAPKPPASFDQLPANQ